MIQQQMRDEVMAYLEQDALRHIALLKMLSLYHTQVRLQYLSSASSTGVMLALPIGASPFDARFYPGYSFAIMLSATSEAVVEALLEQVPPRVPLVFKLLSDADRQTVQTRFALRRAIAVLSFTTPPGRHYQADAAVRTSCEPDPLCGELFAAQGHPAEEVAERFATSDARCFALYQDGIPACACFTYQNYREIYEVSAVYTREEHRRRGLGQRVVTAALCDLLSRGCVPRYQVHEHNAASIALAQRVGLRQFSTLTHWVTPLPG